MRTLIDATTRIFMVAVATYLALRWLEDAAPGRPLHGHGDPDRRVVADRPWLSAIVRHAIDTRRGQDLAGAEGAASLNILRFVGMLVAWLVAFLMLLTNLGIKIGPLVAGLGIGGIAIALAVQNLLGDLFASLSIALDKPFRVGDSLAIGDEKGTVEQIGIKSTRLRSTSGEQIVISNGDLLKSRVRNYSAAHERRAELQLRHRLRNAARAVRRVPAIIEAAIRRQQNTRFERAHFARFGDYALEFEATYMVRGERVPRFHGRSASDQPAAARRIRPPRHHARLPDRRAR